MINRRIKIERLAFKFYQSLPDELITIPINITNIINYFNSNSSFGLKILTYKHFSKVLGISTNELICYCQSEFGCILELNNKFIILYNDSDSYTEQRKIFTIFHELGHWYLKHNVKFDIQKIAQNNTVEAQILEDEADYFAECVLCPTPLIYKWKPSSPSEIQQKFNISKSASKIVWDRYIRYDRIKNISCHNDFIKLFKNKL